MLCACSHTLLSPLPHPPPLPPHKNSYKQTMTGVNARFTFMDSSIIKEFCSTVHITFTQNYSSSDRNVKGKTTNVQFQKISMPPPPTEGFFVLHPLPQGNSSLFSYISSKNLAFKTPLPLGISSDLLWGGYGFFLEPYNAETR